MCLCMLSIINVCIYVCVCVHACVPGTIGEKQVVLINQCIFVGCKSGTHRGDVTARCFQCQLNSIMHEGPSYRSSLALHEHSCSTIFASWQSYRWFARTCVFSYNLIAIDSHDVLIILSLVDSKSLMACVVCVVRVVCVVCVVCVCVCVVRGVCVVCVLCVCGVWFVCAIIYWRVWFVY